MDAFLPLAHLAWPPPLRARKPDCDGCEVRHLCPSALRGKAAHSRAGRRILNKRGRKYPVPEIATGTDGIGLGFVIDAFDARSRRAGGTRCR